MVEKIEKLKKMCSELIQKNQEKLRKLKEKLEQSETENDEIKIEYYKRLISKKEDTIRNCQGRMNNLRMPMAEDTIDRENIIKEFAKKVSEVIPDDVALVFHGNKNISQVEEIIESGGLLTPEERGVESSSYATKIDVTNKYNIQVSLEFAELGGCYIDPYGAVFVFMPKEEEVEGVINSKGTMVEIGVDSIHFTEEPERLIAIITAPENIERLKSVAKKSNLDEEKIMTHEEFLNLCKEKYKTSTK